MRYIHFLLLSTIMMFVSACSSTATTKMTSKAGNTISGTVAAGLLGTSTVTAKNSLGKIISSPDGSNPTLTNVQGQYVMDLGSYSGSVLLEVTGGRYMDEAGLPKTLTTVMRAGMSGLQEEFSTVAITPLTEIAVRLSAGNAENFSIENTKVAQAFGLSDIIHMQPIALKDYATSMAQQTAYATLLASLSPVQSYTK